MWRFLSLGLMCGAVVPAVWAASSNDGGAPHDLSTGLTVNVAAGDILTWTGTVTGGGLLTKTGEGLLILDADNADFSGGISVQAGAVQMNRAGAFGTGTLSSTASGSTARNTYGFIFNAADATVANAINLAPAAYTDWCYNLCMKTTTTFTGTITCTKNAVFGSDNDLSVVTTYGPISATGKTIYFDNYGPLHFRGQVKASNWYLFNNNNTSKPDVYLHACEPAHAVTVAFTVKNPRVYCEAENVLSPTCQLAWNSVSETADKHRIDLQGHDQTVSDLAWSSGQLYGDGKVGSHICSSTGPATLTLTGLRLASNSSTYSYARLMDELTLVVNSSRLTQRLINRTHETTGHLILSNGTLRLEGETSFRKVPQIRVCSAGKLNVESTVAGCFSGATNVVVEAGGTLSFVSSAVAPLSSELTVLALSSTSKVTIPAGMEIAVAELWVDGVRKENGEYTKENLGCLLADGTLKVQKLSRSTATWTGGAASDAVDVAANWDPATVPDLTTGGLLATVASGTRMDLTADASFLGLVFDASLTGFSVAGTKTMAVAGEGVTAANGTEARSWSFEAPVSLTGATSWTFGAQDEVSFSGGIVGGGSMGVVAGSTSIVGMNPFEGNLNLNGGSFFLSGELGVEGDVSSLVQGASGNAMMISNLVCHKRLSFVGKNEAFVFSPASTNVFLTTGTCGTDFLPKVAESARVEFHDELRFDNNSYQVDANMKGTVTFYGTPYFRGNGQLVRAASGVTEWGCEQNTLQVCTFNATYGSSIQRFVSNRVVKIKFEAPEKKHATGVFTCASDTGTCDLGGTVQWFNAATGSKGLVMSERPATLEVLPVVHTMWTSEMTFGPQIEGPVSLLFGPYAGAESAVCTLSGRAFDSTGDLTVTNGTLRLAADCSWLRGTNFTARGTGTFAFSAANQVDPSKAAVHIGDSGVVSIPQGVTVKVAAATLNGATLPPRLYSVASPGPLDGHLAGGGALQVGTIGTLVIFR